MRLLQKIQVQRPRNNSMGKVEVKKLPNQVKANAQEKTTVAIADALTGIDENDHATMLALTAKNCLVRTANSQTKIEDCNRTQFYRFCDL